LVLAEQLRELLALVEIVPKVQMAIVLYLMTITLQAVAVAVADILRGAMEELVAALVIQMMQQFSAAVQDWDIRMSTQQLTVVMPETIQALAAAAVVAQLPVVTMVAMQMLVLVVKDLHRQ
jgi:hypothetical protein